jgi:hypothetical protein
MAWALEPTFVASHTCLASAFSNQIIIVQSDWHLIFILTQMISNIERITQISSQMASFFLRGFFAIYPPTHGRVPFPQGTGVLPVPIESATGKGRSITDTIHVKQCVHLNYLLYTPKNCMIVYFKVVGRCRHNMRASTADQQKCNGRCFPTFANANLSDVEPRLLISQNTNHPGTYVELQAWTRAVDATLGQSVIVSSRSLPRMPEPDVVIM